MRSLPYNKEPKLRTKGEYIDEPTEWFHAEPKVSTNFFSESNIRVTIVDVDPIANIYNDSGRPPRREDVIRVVAKVMRGTHHRMCVVKLSGVFNRSRNMV